MTIHTDPNAAHAIYSPSSAHRWTVCTASAEAIAHLPPQEEGEAAAKGTAAHEELERVLGGGEADPEHDAAYAVALAVNYIKQLPPGKTWVEQRVALTDQIWGRCDFSHWHAETNTLTIVDLKNGFVGVDADAEQLQIYASAAMFTHSLPVKWVRLVIVQPHDFRPGVPRVKQHVMSVDELYSFAERVAAIPKGPKSFVAGEQCTYCPLFGKCDASRDMLANIGALVAGLMQPADVTLAQRALFLACQKPVSDAFKNAEKAWLKDALTKGAPEGLKVVTTTKHRAWKDPAAARALLLEKLGPDGLDIPTPAQAIERGVPEATVHEMAPRPEGGPALAFASDKRPEFSRKSAAQMFAGVTGTK